MWKRMWDDPVWSKVISAGIIATVVSGGSYLLNWWPMVGGFLEGVFTWALASSPVRNWVLVVLVILALPVVMLMVMLLWERLRPTKSQEADEKSYTKDEFFGLRWRWKYGAGGIYDLATFCPRCDYQVLPKDVSSYRAFARTEFHCENCGAEFKEFDVSWPVIENRAERLIQQKLRNGTWPKPNGV